MTTDRPNIAFLGTGFMGQLAHLANYALLRDAGECRIAGVTDLKRGLAAAVAEKYGVNRVYASDEELLADPGVDAVVCVQQWPNNYPLVKRILTAGKSVITEKPMVGRVDEAEELVALAQDRGLLYAVGFMKRSDPGVTLARRLLDDPATGGSLGQLLTLDAMCNGGDWLQNPGSPISVDDPGAPGAAPPTYPDGCRTPGQRAAYGYLINIFSHNVNLCHYFLGAEMQPKLAQFRGDRAVTIAAACGQTLVTVRGAGSPAPDWRERTTLTFEHGEMRVTTHSPMNRQARADVCVLRKDDGAFAETEYHAPVGWSFFLQAQNFVRALAGKEALRSPAETCVWDVRAMSRAIEMAEIL